ncbi:glycoside hydrolase family 43 protein [Microbacterium sp. NPDC089320]|uniref:glycoside hydrolase family 43 protein n=1 Tax=Microbacterium sp. NPDC089320 TaxID=3155182 RepID=UPI00343F426C
MASTNASVTPIVSGFHPDPTICRVGGDYYLATSSFEYFPGVPLFHSTDLVTWTQIGNVMTTREQFVEGAARPSGGLWAGTLRHRDGLFYYITTNVSDFDAGQIIVTASDPAGPWSEPVHVRGAIGIDPDICWDDDGVCLVTWHRFNWKVGGIDVHQVAIDPATGELLGESYPVWQGSGMPAAEGPHLYHIGDWWYLMFAEGGTEKGHSVTVARAPRPEGPYEGCPANPILTRRSTFAPVVHTGHADLVQTPEGDWAAVYLGVRPAGSTPGYHVLGRESFLSGIDWVDGWPVFVTDRYEIPTTDPGFAEDFTGGAAAWHPRWVVPAGDLSEIDLSDGAARVPAGRALCVRVTDLTWEAEAELSGSFELRIDARHSYRLEVEGDRVRAVRTVGGFSQIVASHEVAGATERVSVRISAVPSQERTVPLGDAGPDEILLAVRDGDAWTELARLDGRYVSTEVASGFTGRVLAVGDASSDTLLRTMTYRGR